MGFQQWYIQGVARGNNIPGAESLGGAGESKMLKVLSLTQYICSRRTSGEASNLLLASGTI